MKRVIPILITLLVASQFSCDDKGVDVLPPKNPRDYTWTVDTLIAHPDAIQTWMWDIYGTSPENVYVVGHTDWTGINGSGIMWRYNGTAWSIVNQGFRDISLESITGFGPSNIYAAGNKGDNALILHFDGTNWTQTILPGYGLWSIRGSGPSDIWAGGWGGAVFHFDGLTWTKIDANGRLNFRKVSVLDGTAYSTAYRLDEEPLDTTWRFFLKWTNSAWDTLDSFIETGGSNNLKRFGMGLSVVEGQLYSAGGGIYRFELGSWKHIFSGPNVWEVAGPSKSNMFATGYQGTVYHYNGSDWHQFTQFVSPGVGYSGIWFDRGEVFIVGNDGQKSIVLHGK